MRRGSVARHEPRQAAEVLNFLADEIFGAVGAYDYARVDFRPRGTRCYVLEINIMPIRGPHNFLSLAARRLGFPHENVICLIELESMKRRGLRMTA